MWQSRIATGLKDVDAGELVSFGCPRCVHRLLEHS